MYFTPARFAEDFRLIVANAQQFNHPGDPVYNFASELGAAFEKSFQENVMDVLQREKEKRHKEKAERKAKKAAKKAAKAAKKLQQQQQQQQLQGKR